LGSIEKHNKLSRSIKQLFAEHFLGFVRLKTKKSSTGINKKIQLGKKRKEGKKRHFCSMILNIQVVVHFFSNG